MTTTLISKQVENIEECELELHDKRLCGCFRHGLEDGNEIYIKKELKLE